MRVIKSENLPVMTFTTDRGSTYTVNGQGQTQRTKTPQPGRNDAGLQELSVQTVYVGMGVATVLVMFQMSRYSVKGVVVEHGMVRPWFKSPRKGWQPVEQAFPFSPRPEIGKYPIEFWGPIDTFGPHQIYRSWHVGSKIASIGDGK